MQTGGFQEWLLGSKTSTKSKSTDEKYNITNHFETFVGYQEVFD